MTTLLIIIGSIFVAGGQMFLKKSLGTTPADMNVAGMYVSLFKSLLSPKALASLFIIGIGSLTYFLALRLGAISAVVPATASLIIAFTALIGWAVMKDPMPAVKIAGLLLIIGGVVLVSHPA